METDAPVQILALAGSYRTHSFNQALLRAVKELSPDNVEIVEFDLRTVPHYDGDLEDAGDPTEVQNLKRAVESADAVLLVTPEYNSGAPGVLKNGIDWASRVYPNAPLGDKSVAMIGASPGRSGTKYAQGQLRDNLSRAGAVLIEGVELMLARAGEAIVDGKVVSDDVRAQISATLETIVQSVAMSRAEGSGSDAE